MAILRSIQAGVLSVLACALTAQLSACSLLQAAAGTEPPEVRLVDLEVVQVGLFEQDYRVTLRLRNPNDFAIPVDGLKFELEVNERPFAVGMSSSSLEIPRLGEATVDVRATTSTFDLIGQAMGVGEGEALQYKLSGTLFVANRLSRRIRFEREGKLADVGGNRGGPPAQPGSE